MGRPTLAYVGTTRTQPGHSSPDSSKLHQRWQPGGETEGGSGPCIRSKLTPLQKLLPEATLTSGNVRTLKTARRNGKKIQHFNSARILHIFLHFITSFD